MKRPFLLNKGIVVPKTARQIEMPFEGTGLRVVSDLIPTYAITEDWPALGDQLDSIDFMNAPNPDAFAAYKLFNFGKERDGSWFTRLHFFKERADQLTVPVVTYKTNRALEWPAILEGIAWLADADLPQSVVLENKTIRNRARVYPRVAYRPSYYGDTLIQVEHFISLVEFPADLIKHPQPQPDAIMWNVRDTEGNFQRCLHPEVLIPNQLGSFRLISQSGRLPVSARAGLGQIFPATNPPTWHTYVPEDHVEQQQGLFLRTKITAFPPRRRAVVLL